MWLNGFNDNHTLDKVVQHNFYGTVTLGGLYAEEFGELYCPCSTCEAIPSIKVVENALRGPLVRALELTKTYSDLIIMKNIRTSDGCNDAMVCQRLEDSIPPTNMNAGPSATLYQYSESDGIVTGIVPSPHSMLSLSTGSSFGAEETKAYSMPPL